MVGPARRHCQRGGGVAFANPFAQINIRHHILPSTNLNASMMVDVSTDVNASGQNGGVPTTMLSMANGDLAVCCVPLTGEVINPADAEQLARRFKALGDPTRVRLLSLIAAHDGGEACICDLIDPVGLSQPTVSHHVRQLADAGLVTRQQRGKWAYYRIVDDALTALAAAIKPST
jgi:ArsR family transcriptional regulator